MADGQSARALTRRSAARVLLAIAGLAVLLAGAVSLTGGFRVYVLGVPLSTRGTFRPLVTALVLAAGALALDAALRTRLVAAAGALVKLLVHPNARRAAAPAAAAAAALWVLHLGVFEGSRAAGGSDSYGYVSQALLWRDGIPRVVQPFVRSVPWPRAAATFRPLGYRTTDDGTLVPSYPPGLPLLMAAAGMVAGACGPFLVAPLCAAALIVLTYALGVRVSGQATGAAAALCVGLSPTVLMMALGNMSDVPAAFFWTAALLLAGRTRRLRALACGVCAGAAIAIRPNLAPLAAVPLLMIALGVWSASRREAATRIVLFAGGAAPFVAGVAWLFDEWYGSPFRSGYGTPSSLYAWTHAGPNLARYSSWLLETQGPLVFACLLVKRTKEGFLLLVFALGVFASYVFYEPFDSWWYLRFLIPAFPVIFVLAADAVQRVAARRGSRARAAALALFTLVTIGFGVAGRPFEEALAVGRGEQRHAVIGRHVDLHLPPNAIVLSAQHSGMIRFYSGRLTLRFDALDPHWLDRAVGHLRRRGLEPYAVLDAWEISRFTTRFAKQKTVAALQRPPLAATPGRDAFVFALDPESPPAARTAVMAPLDRSELCQLGGRVAAWPGVSPVGRETPRQGRYPRE